MRKRKMRAVLCLAVVLALLAGLGHMEVDAASSGEIRQQINELEAQEEALREQMEMLEQQMEENLGDIQTTVRNKNSIDQQIVLLYQQVDNINAQISAYRVLIADTQAELTRAEAILEQLNARYRERIRAMEEEGALSYWAVLFKANSFADLLDRLNMIQEIAESDQRRLQELRNAAAVVEETSQRLETEKASLENTLAVLQQTERELDEKRKAAEELLQQLISQGEAFAELLLQSEEAQDALMQEIAAKEKEFDEAVYQEWLATSVPETTEPTAPTGGTHPDGTEWLVPVPYYTLTSPFGMRVDPITGEWRMHNGVDLACAENTPIYATRSGMVTIARWSDSAGNYVSINHGDGYASVYMHMIRYVVSEGEYVTAGQVIGYVGNTGMSKGNHLHFGISYDGAYVNPMEYIG